jgi:cysteine desulfurase
MKEVIYLDNASTTPCYKEVVKVMNEVMLNNFGNPSSSHALGENARDLLIEAKRTISKEINSKPFEVIFTSGATESNNIAIRSLALAYPKRKKIIISAIEHSSIYEVCEYLREKGYQIVHIPVDKEGFVDLIKLENEIDDSTLLVSIMHANNEIGVIQDISAIGEICRAKKALFHTDAVQSFTKDKIDVQTMKIDLLSASGHKIGGPKGIGFLYVREDVNLVPIIFGGDQEKGLRGGTENVAGIVGFSKAVEITKKIDQKQIKEIRNIFIEKLEKMGCKINGSKNKRLANNINAIFPKKDSETIVSKLSDKGIMCSTRSACLSKQKKENRVLSALGLSKEESNSSVRFSISEKTSEKEIKKVINELKKL